jgi:hypothetical protein
LSEDTVFSLKIIEKDKFNRLKTASHRSKNEALKRLFLNNRFRIAEPGIFNDQKQSIRHSDSQPATRCPAVW